MFAVRRQSSTEHGIIIRQVHHSEIFVKLSPELAHKQIVHVAAYRSHALGELLGHISVHPKKKLVLSTRIFECPEQEVVKKLLEQDISVAFEIDTKDAGISAPMSSGIKLMIPDRTKHVMEISMKLRYAPLLAGHDREFPLGVSVYPTFSFSHSKPVFFSHADIATLKHVVLRFECNTTRISKSTLLNFEAWANLVNQDEDACRNQAGYTNVPFSDLVDTSVASISRPMIVPNSSIHTTKGNIFIFDPVVTIDGVKVVSCVRPTKPLVNVKVINSYICKNGKFYHSIPSRFKSITNLGVFTYASRRGNIPGCMFDIPRKIPETKEVYYLNALRVALQRTRPFQDVTHEDVQQLFSSKGSVQEQALVGMIMLCVFVNYCDYITDEVDNNAASSSTYSKKMVELIESFDTTVRFRNAGDCEDFTLEILIEVAEIKYNVHIMQSEVMHTVKAIFDKFIFASSLCGVSNASISFSSASSSNDSHLNGHECAIAIPKHLFFKALDSNHPLHQLYSDEEKSRGSEFSICVLEGTGNLHPIAKKQSKAASTLMKHILGNLPDRFTDHFRKQNFYRPESDDNFYKVFLTFLTSEPFLEKGHRGFEYLLCNTNETGSVVSKGVPFSEFLEEMEKEKEKSNIVIIETIPMPLSVFHQASKIDADNFPPTTIRHAHVSLPPKRALAGPFPDINDIVSFQVSYSHATPEFLESLSKKLSSLNLRMTAIPEDIKADHQMRGVVGGYIIFVYH